MSQKLFTLDVREDLRRGQDPFARIMQAVAKLKAHEDLLLIAPFQPIPLFGVLAQQGFSHEATETASGDWEVRFTRSPETEPAHAAAPMPTPTPKRNERRGTDVLEVDARGLEPPQPLVKILEALTTLPAGVTLAAHTDRRPMHLFAHLAERGFEGESQEQADGSFVTHVRRL